MTDFSLDQLWKLTEFGEKTFRYDEDGLFILISMDDNFCKMLGYDKSELMIRCHNRAKDLIYPPDLPRLHEHVMRELKEKEEYTARYRMRKRDGALIWVWESGVMEYDLSGNRYVHNLVVNISEIENMRKDRDITYDNLPGGVLRMLISENNFYIMDFNQQYLDMMGTTQDEYMGSSGLYTFPEDIRQLRDHVTLQAKNRETIDYEFRCRCGEKKDVHWFRLIGRFYDEVEDGCEYLCLMIDITTRRHSVMQLERERTRYQMAMRMTAGMLFEYDERSHRLRVYDDTLNSAYVPCIRDGRFEDLDHIFFHEDFLHPDDHEKMRRYLKVGADYGVRVRLLAENKESGVTDYYHFEIVLNKAWLHEGLQYVVGSIRHIDEQNREESVYSKLYHILLSQSGRMYERVTCVDTETEELSVYISEQVEFREYIPDCRFDEYIARINEVAVYPEDQDRFRSFMSLANMQQILESTRQEILFFRMRSNDREEYRYKCIRYSYLGGDARTIFISMQDAHRIHEEQLKTEDANKRILASAINEGRTTMEIRRNFAAMLSRELHAPLAYVNEQIHKKDMNMEEVRDAVVYMQKVIQNISHYEQLEQGQVRFENKLFELDELLWDVFHTWKERLDRDAVNISYRLDLTWKYYYGDAAHLIQCLNHVIGNCVVASEGKGTIDIWGSDEDQGDGISHLNLVLEDTGIPVNENFFGRAYSIKDIDNQSLWKKGYNRMGTCFSLIVARKIIELLGGSIRLHRKEEKRNIIEITLPFQRSQNMREKARPVTTTEETLRDVDFSGYSLLVLENTQLLGPNLKLKNARVDVASSGKEGIKRWLSYSPYYFDAILVEGNLPDMDYLYFAEQLRSQDAADAATIPILAMADMVGQQRMRQGMCRGVNAVLGRTIDFGKLKQILDVLVKETKKK